MPMVVRGGDKGTKSKRKNGGQAESGVAVF